MAMNSAAQAGPDRVQRHVVGRPARRPRSTARRPRRSRGLRTLGEAHAVAQPRRRARLAHRPRAQPASARQARWARVEAYAADLDRSRRASRGGRPARHRYRCPAIVKRGKTCPSARTGRRAAADLQAATREIAARSRAGLIARSRGSSARANSRGKPGFVDRPSLVPLVGRAQRSGQALAPPRAASRRSKADAGVRTRGAADADTVERRLVQRPVDAFAAPPDGRPTACSPPASAIRPASRAPRRSRTAAACSLRTDGSRLRGVVEDGAAAAARRHQQIASHDHHRQPATPMSFCSAA